jgi:Type IX secretion system protein PorV
MRRSPSSWLGALACLGVAVPLAAQTSGDLTTGGAAFLLVPVGARASAMGQTGVAAFGTGEAAFWNPAGLALLPESELGIHHATTFASDNTVLSGYLSSRLLGVVGVAAYLVDYGSQDIVPPSSQQPIGKIRPLNLELLASYASTLGHRVSFGVNYKLIQLRTDCSGNCGGFVVGAGTTHAVDLGLQYGSDSSDGLRLGVALRHAGFDLQLVNASQADPLPTRVAVGAAYGMSLPTPTGAQPASARVLIDSENPCCSTLRPDLRVGSELAYGETVRLRAGYAFLRGRPSGPSVGAGLRFGRAIIDFARVFFSSGNFDEPVYLSLRVIL